MQDFTNADKELPVTANLSATDSVIQNAYGGTYDKPKARKVGFIEARKNSDNFWNLMFWLGMVISTSFVDLFANFIPILALLFFILTLTAVPYGLTRFNKVTYKDKIFFNKKGSSLANRYPKNLPLVLAITVPVSVMLFFAVDKNFPAIKNMVCVYTAIALMCPILYFILINCPISILFNKNAWNEEVTGLKNNSGNRINYPSSSLIHNSHKSSLSPRSWSTDPSYKHLSSNIHHRR